MTREELQSQWDKEFPDGATLQWPVGDDFNFLRTPWVYLAIGSTEGSLNLHFFGGQEGLPYEFEGISPKKTGDDPVTYEFSQGTRTWVIGSFIPPALRKSTAWAAQRDDIRKTLKDWEAEAS